MGSAQGVPWNYGLAYVLIPPTRRPLLQHTPLVLCLPLWAGDGAPRASLSLRGQMCTHGCG